MNTLDEFVASLGLSYDKMTNDEQASYKKMYDSISGKALTVDDIQQMITRTRQEVSYLVCDTKNDAKDDQQLKARLKDLLIIESFLSGPVEAKKVYERMLQRKLDR